MKLKLAVHKNAIPNAIKPHLMHYSELTLVLNGSMEYGDGTQWLPLKAGDILYLKEGTIRTRKEGQELAEYISFNFNAEREYALPSVIQGGINSEIKYMVELFDRIDKQRYLENSTARMESLIAMILMSLEDELQVKKMQPLVHQIIRYLHTHLAEKITLARVAEQCFFSPSYCDRVFKNETGQSIIDYLLELRVEEAKLLLSQGQYPIQVIGEMVGLADANYFSRLFKRRTGYSPSEYRRRFIF